MTFSQIPEQFSPIGDEIVYVVENPDRTDLDIRVCKPNGPEILGCRRFLGASSARCDIAPILRRLTKFLPATDETGFTPAQGRTVTVAVEAAAAGSFPDPAGAKAPARTFIVGRERPAEPALRTSMPEERLIPEGAGDELSITTAESRNITAILSVRIGRQTTEYRHSAQGAGLFLFRLDTRDFPGAEEITVDFGSLGRIHYSVVPARSGSCRLAWRSACGSIEHYSFPTIREVGVRSEKVRTERAEGYAVRTLGMERRMRLESAFEAPDTMQALAEITASPEVWRFDGGFYRPVDVLTQEAATHRLGSLCSLDIEIRERKKYDTPWN